MVMPYHLHMPSYFLETFTEYPYVEMRFQRQLQKLGYIGILMMMTNICIRLVTRLVPNSLRGWIYKKFLRK